MKKLIVYGWLMSCMSLSAHLQRVVIWDLGGVLFYNSKLTYVNSIGFKPIFSYMVAEKTAPWKFSAHIQNRVFAVLHAVSVDEHVVGKGSCIPGGLAMPPVLWAFQAGLVTADECIKRSEKVLQEFGAKGYFKNPEEKELVNRIICAAFTPALSVSSCTVRTETMKIVRHLSSQRYTDGTKKYKLFVLSNWDPWSFAHIKKKFARELSYFDDVIISGDIQLMKPMKEIFGYVVEKHKVSKDDCVFIDDQLENIEGARSFGIKYPIHFKNSMHLRRQLRSIKIL